MWGEEERRIFLQGFKANGHLNTVLEKKESIRRAHLLKLMSDMRPSMWSILMAREKITKRLPNGTGHT
jgi:hypothetical protein